MRGYRSPDSVGLLTDSIDSGDARILSGSLNLLSAGSKLMMRNVALCVLLALVAALLAAAGSSTAAPLPEYRLRFYHTHTNERLDIVYRRGDVYFPEALDRLDYYLRDYRTGDVHRYDPRVFDLLHELTSSLGRPYAEIDVVCGYRTPRTNEFLRSRNVHTGVARHSLHMQAEAIDIRLPGVPTAQLRDAAVQLHRGGVGYYRASDFVHLDVGRVRCW
jgi:uncharacterized protein YcbK (DUF882 family)